MVEQPAHPDVRAVPPQPEGQPFIFQDGGPEPASAVPAPPPSGYDRADGEPGE